MPTKAPTWEDTIEDAPSWDDTVEDEPALSAPSGVTESFMFPAPDSGFGREAVDLAPPSQFQDPGLLSSAAPLAAGIETGLNTPEKMIRSGLDLVGWYPLLDKLTGSGTKYQDYNKGWMDYFTNREVQLQKENERLGQTGFVPELLQGTAQAAVELPVQLLGGAAAATPKAAVIGSSLMAGAMGGLGEYGQERQEGKGRLESASKGAVSGAITALTTRAFGATGVESIFKKEGVAGLKNRIKEALRQMGYQGFEEAADQFQQDLLERATENPNKPIEQTVHDVLLAGSIGTVLGGGVSAATQGVNAAREALAEKTAEPLLKKPPGETTAKEMMSLSDAEARKFFEGNQARGNATQNDSVLAGVKLGPEAVPELTKMRDAAHKAALVAIGKGDVDGGFAGQGRVVWLNGAIEGANKSGPNFSAVKPTAPPEEEQSTPVEPQPTESQTEKETVVQPEGGVSIGQEVQMQGQEEVLSEPAAEATEVSAASSPLPVGPGAMAKAEAVPPKPFVTSNKGAVVDEERKARGLKPMMALERQTNPEAWDSAMRQIDENPQIQDELISELTTTPRALTATENSILMHRRIDLRNEYEKALFRWREAFESDDMVRAAEESGRVRDWSSKLSDLEDITKATGAESGRSLQARKMMANEDYSLAAMELRAMEAKGRSLTNEEHVQLIKSQERILELENRLTALEETREGSEVETVTTETMKEVSTEAPKESKSKDFDLDREENLIGAIKAKVDKGQLNDITSLVQQLARVFWRRGIRGREPMIDALHETLKIIIPEFSREDTKRAFSGYGNFKPLSKEEIDVGLRDLRGQTQQVLKMEALEARKPLEKTGQERRVPTDEERRLIKQVNELKRKYGVVVTDPATQLKSALAARKTYYEHRIADLKHEIETRQRIVKSKTASPTDAELDLMIAERDRLQREHDTIFPKQEMSPEQQLKQAIAAAQRNLAHWEVRLENADKGIFSKRTPGRKVTSAELELIQAETAAIREHVKELKDLQNPKKTKEEIALQSLKTRMKTREAEFRRRIKDKDFAKKAITPVKLDAEALKLKASLDLAKEEFQSKLEQDRWARLSVFQKTKRKVADVYDAARALMTTGEFSFILRQGKLAVLSHPIKTAKALPKMFKALLASPQGAREIDLEIHKDPDADAARQAKLYLVDDSTRLSRQEEILMGRLVGKIPVVRNFNQAAQVFLNKVRLDMWKAMRKSLSKSGTPTPEEDKQIAMFVNEATGRGGLGKLEPAGVVLSRIFFAPKYWASRLQLVAGHSMWGGTMRTRRIIATEYARALVGLGLYYTALALFFGDDDDEDKGKIEVDPRSGDFGKVKVGNTRLDPLTGLSQQIVLGARTVTGEKKTLSGEVQTIRGKEVPFGGDKWSDIVARHLRGKLHPVPSSVANLFDGTDLGGDEATVLNQAGNMVAPITYIDIYTALKEQGLDDGAALALLALLGEGIQTYEKK